MVDRFTVEWKERVDQIFPSFWDFCFRPPVEGRWWYEALEQSGLESQFKFMYGLVRKNNVAVAIAPAFFMDVPMEIVAPPWIMPWLLKMGRIFPNVLVQPTLFVGSPCTDEGTIGIVPGVDLEQLVPAIHQAVELRAAEIGAQMIVWKDFPLQSKPPLDELCDSHGLFASLSYPGTMIKLSSTSLDSYYGQLKGSRRHNLKKKLKRSRENVELSARVIQSPDEEVLKEIWSLFCQTYDKGETKFERLTPAFFENIASKPASHFVLLREVATGQLVAFMLCFKIGTRVINKFIGLDYTRPSEWFLYFRLWDCALKWVLESGAAEFQSGQTGYRAKIDVGHELVVQVNYCRNRNPFFNEVYRRVGPTINWSDLDHDLATFISAHPEANYTLATPQQSRQAVLVG